MRTSFLLNQEPLSVQKVQDLAADKSTGAQVLFVGVVRNQSSERNVRYLEFEAYESMAINELEKIAQEIFQKWPVEKVVLHHALGRRYVGELAVAAAISAKHRKEAFEACEYLMHRLKQSVPIWKKEKFEDGEQWVSATP